MDSPFFIAYLIVAALAVGQALALTLQTWEHCRYARSCMKRQGRYRAAGRAAVFAPVKGGDVDLEANLRALFRQDHGEYELTFIVESTNDVACEVIRRVMREHPEVASRLVVAGRATDSGQKVHNLRVATDGLAPEVKYLAFVDSDAQPRPEWLRLLIARLDRPGMGAATGYRWFVPSQPTLANLLLYSINCGVMVLLGRQSHSLVWGGSWAIRRDLFDALSIREAWQGTLSDDLVASRLLREAGVSTRFEPVAVVASPLDLGGGEMLAFLRRQYLVGRCYSPRWWTLGLGGTTPAILAWLGSLAAVGWGLLAGTLPLWIPLGAAVALYLVNALRGGLRQGLVRTYFPGQYEQLRAARWFDVVASPLVAVVNWLVMLSSMFGRRIRWRGVEYHVGRRGRLAGCYAAPRITGGQRVRHSRFGRAVENRA
jgi:hypothetical protein